MSKKYKLNWTGDDAIEQVLEKVADGFGRFGLRVEGEAKKELRPFHGVKTGTLRRSVHAADPEYDWSGDDEKPSSGSTERGGVLVKAIRTARGIVIAVGSGLKYALPVHQGHGSFDGYHFITNGLRRAKGNLKKDIEESTLSKLT